MALTGRPYGDNALKVWWNFFQQICAITMKLINNLFIIFVY